MHCCVCARYCAHIGPIVLCDSHDPEGPNPFLPKLAQSLASRLGVR